MASGCMCLKGSEAVTEEVPDHIPARMLNEFVYCPRLFFLEFVDGLFADSADTVAGSLQHRRQDRPGESTRQTEPEAEEEPEFIRRVRALQLADDNLGLTARLDVVEEAGGVWCPVDYKHGAPPDPARVPADRLGPSGAWQNDEVQLCAQGLLLAAQGMPSPRGILYYRQTREQRPVEFSPELQAMTRVALADARSLAASGAIPPPLVDDPRCVRCSLAPICLPEETAFLAGGGEAGSTALRRVIPGRDDEGVLYVNTQGAVVGREGEVLIARYGKEKLGDAPLSSLRQVCLFGQVQITTPALQLLLRDGVPVCFFSRSGFFYGLAQGMPTKNVEWRRQQYLRFHHPETALELSRRIVTGKIQNQRTLLMRNHPNLPAGVADRLKDLAGDAEKADTPESLLGLEGAAAAAYFGHFGGMLRGEGAAGFDFEKRNRRPPRDPVNALLSLAYAVLVKDLTVACYAAGLDPMFGFYHRPRFGRPALALDLMEEFRSLVADSVVLTLINNQMVTPADFVQTRTACNLNEKGRAAFFTAYERRKQQLITHPLFGYRISYGRVLEVQARLLGRYLTDELPEYRPFVTR